LTRAEHRRARVGGSLLALTLALILFQPLPARAWNAAGHRLVACVAWIYLDAQSRSEISSLLRGHPDYMSWLSKAESAQAERGAFIEASTWADDIRKDARFFSAGVDEPTPGLPGFPDMQRHPDWHYLNRPLDGTPGSQGHDASVSGRLDSALAALSKSLKSSAVPFAERAYALPWLIHLVGDAHQPLHTSSRIDAQGLPDKLGNGLTVFNPYNPRKRTSTLHAFWDDLPGPPWLRGAQLDAGCRELVSSLLQHRPAPASIEQWIDESWQIAGVSAYPPGAAPIATISESFYEKSREIANRRVALAGYRLAGLLGDLLARPGARD